MRCCRRKNIPSVKYWRNRLSHVLFIGNFNSFLYVSKKSCCRNQNAIIGPYQIIPSSGFNNNWLPFCPDSRINYTYMESSWHMAQGFHRPRCIKQVKIRKPVHQVDYICIWIYFQRSGFHYANALALHSKIACQADEWLFHRQNKNYWSDTIFCSCISSCPACPIIFSSSSAIRFWTFCISSIWLTLSFFADEMSFATTVPAPTFTRSSDVSFRVAFAKMPDVRGTNISEPAFAFLNSSMLWLVEVASMICCVISSSCFWSCFILWSRAWYSIYISCAFCSLSVIF